MTARLDIAGGALVTHSITVAGAALPDSYQVYSIVVEKEANRIASATIVLLDGSAATESFPVSASESFVPGNAIKIEAGYDGINSLLFEGIVTCQSLRVESGVGSMLEVTCKDKAVGMTVGRKSCCYQKQTDSQVMSALVANTAGLEADIAETSNNLPQLVQYYCTDWDFLLSRAEANGFVVSTVNGKVAAFKFDAKTQPVLTAKYGANLYSFDTDLNAVTQLGEVKASAWDYQSQQLINGHAGNSVPGPGNLSSESLSKKVGSPPTFELQTTAPLDADSLSSWAMAQMRKSEYSKITGQLRCAGTTELEVGQYVSVDGLGPRFDGAHFVASVGHEIANGNWFLDIGIGLRSQWFTEAPDIAAPLAAGLLPGVQGLFNATVKKIYEDPDSEYRILIDLPLFDPNGVGLWARLTNLYSTSGAGYFFLPEVGDEVIVGFLNEDPRFPIILGSVYSANKLPYSEFSPNEKNTTKGIVTRSGLRIVFDDEKKVLQIVTPANNECIFSDENKQIFLQDQTGNKIEMSETGISISSPKAITMSAETTVEISGDSGVTVKSPDSVTVTGASVSISAEDSFSASGEMTAEVKGGMELSLSAAMVKIN